MRHHQARRYFASVSRATRCLSFPTAAASVLILFIFMNIGSNHPPHVHLPSLSHADVAASSRSSTFSSAATLQAKCCTCSSSFHVQWRHASQVCASGALLNCIGPSLSPVFEHPRRKTLRKVGMCNGI
jgi:hypothetical protein